MNYAGEGPDLTARIEQRRELIVDEIENGDIDPELKEIAAMAEPNYVAVSPHNYNSTTIGLAATIQVSACIPNFLITEYFVNFEETGNEVAVNPFRVENGYIELPAAPGLGIELKEEELLERPYLQYSPRSLRHYHQEGP